MGPSQLSDEKLLQNTKELIKKERALIHEILLHLREIEDRKLYCDLKCTSLFDYCLKELGYSEDEAYRRISAMRFLKKNPTIIPNVVEGELTLSSLNLLNAFQKNHQDLDIQEAARDLLGKSKRESESILNEKAREAGATPPAPEKPVITKKDDAYRLHLTLSKELFAKWNKIKGLRAHQKDKSIEKMFEEMCDLMILEEEKKHVAPKKKEIAKKSPAPEKKSQIKTANKTQESPTENNKIKNSRYIKKAVKDFVYTQSSGKCSNCQSDFKLEYNHKLAFALGGKSSIDNINLLCSNCNKRQMVKDFGIKKAKGILNKVLKR